MHRRSISLVLNPNRQIQPASRSNPIESSKAAALTHPSPYRFTQLLCVLLFAVTLPAQRLSQTRGPETKPDPPSLIQQANQNLAAGDFPAALKLLTTLNTQTPNNPEVLYDLGLTLEALDATSTDPKAPTAEACYRQAIAANPLFPAAHVALGLLLGRSSQPLDARDKEARAELHAATTLPGIDSALKARALRALARLDLNDNAPAEASADLLAALNLTPEAPEDILLAAEIARATGDLAAAEQTYRRYLNLPGNANDPGVTAALAHVLVAQRHNDEAASILTAALAAHPGDPGLTAQLAAAYLSSGDDAEVALAAPLLESLHAANPGDRNIARLLARVYLETGHPDRADPLYAAIISAEFQNGAQPDPTLLNDRADALLRLHRPGEAEKMLKEATANPSAFPTPAALGDAATHLAFAASEIDDPRGVLQALSLRSTVLPPSPSTLFLEAAADDTLHQSAKAVDLYKQFLALAHGEYPQQESQARQRLAALQHTK
jgi:predicted Zn-dependent protease